MNDQGLLILSERAQSAMGFDWKFFTFSIKCSLQRII